MAPEEASLVVSTNVWRFEISLSAQLAVALYVASQGQERAAIGALQKCEKLLAAVTADIQRVHGFPSGFVSLLLHHAASMAPKGLRAVR